MNGRIRLSLAPAELARLLTEAARSVLEEKAITVADLRAELGDDLELRVKVKDKDGRRKFKIEIIWPQTSEGPGTDKGSLKADKGSVKAIKREMRVVLGRMRADVAAGTLPEMPAVRQLDGLIGAFAGKAKAEWRQGLDDLSVAANRLSEAIESRDIAEAEAAVRRLYQIEGACHRRFK